jgi:hypothetical protein
MGREGEQEGLQGQGKSETAFPSNSIGTQASRHTFFPEYRIAHTSHSKTAETGAIAVEDDTIAVLLQVPAAKGGEGGCRRTDDRQGEGMEVPNVGVLIDTSADRPPEPLGEGATQHNV